MIAITALFKRQWLQLQQLRSKVKRRHIDTKASKGRKIRFIFIINYNTHPYCYPVKPCLSMTGAGLTIHPNDREMLI